MKIIILGAGEVGGNLAQNLTKEASDITVVDHDADRLRELQDRFDIRTVRGQASHPDVMRQAGAEDADMLIAVTNSDEVNMVACQVAYSVFHTPQPKSPELGQLDTLSIRAFFVMKPCRSTLL